MRRSLDAVDLERFRSLIAARLGLQFDDARLDQLAQVLRQRLEERGGMNPGAYLTSLASDCNGRNELRSLASLLTVTETYFFRGLDHFRALTEAVLPDRLRTGNAQRPLRFLSAGCASGEEAYSLAMAWREHFAGLSQPGATIEGIDVNPVMLAKAREGRYREWSLRETTPEIRDKYFHAEGECFLLDESIRAMVSFEERNLAVEDGTHWGRDQYDIIFCRNMMMYLVPDAVRTAVALLTRLLAPAGFLFLSHAETLRGISQDFHLRHTHGTFYYQKRGEGEAEKEPHPAVDFTPPIDAQGVSWVETIRQASKRIENLSRAGMASAGLPPDDARHAPQRTSAQLGFAFELLRQERYREALQALESLPPEMAADCDVQLLQAVLLTNCGDMPAAQTTCQQVLASDDLNAGAHYLSALCREHAGDPRGAMEHDRAAIYLDPVFAMPHLHVGLLAKRSGDLIMARRELAQAGILLPREDASRILLLGGGFSREALLEFSRAELRACGGKQ